MVVMRQIITRVPDDLAERLKERAAIENRSINATVVDAVERVLAVPEVSLLGRLMSEGAEVISRCSR